MEPPTDTVPITTNTTTEPPPQIDNTELTLPPVSFSSQTSSVVDSLNVARKKHEERAKRFGVEYVEPKLKVVDVKAPKRYMNPRHSGFVTGFAIDDEAEKKKRELRAKKFGAPIEENNNNDNNNDNNNNENSSNNSNITPQNETDNQIDNAMDGGMDVDLREERKDVGVHVQRRLDTIYLYGTDNMSTEDIFAYFKDYGAACVEWINDSSCNVIFLDVHTAMRALQGMSKPLDEFNLQITKDSGLISITPQDQSTTQVTSQTTTTVNPTDPTTAQPDQTTAPTETTTTITPQQPSITQVQATPEQITLYGWRKGKSVKGVPMLMRYATVEDVKSKDFKPSAYYKRLLSQLREQKKNKGNKRGKNRGSKNRDDTGRNRNRNRNRDRNQDGKGRGKRKFDDGDIDMADPVEQEKRLQRRKKFFPESEEQASNETNYIISSTTVPALLQQASGSQPTPTAEPVPEASANV